MLGILSLLEVAMTFMASISKITLNSNTYEFKEAKDPIVIKTFESPPFSKEYMYGMHTFEINEVGPDGYKAVGIVHNDTTGVVFPCNVVFSESGGKTSFTYWAFNPTGMEYPGNETFTIRIMILYVRT